MMLKVGFRQHSLTNYGKIRKGVISQQRFLRRYYFSTSGHLFILENEKLLLQAHSRASYNKKAVATSKSSNLKLVELHNCGQKRRDKKRLAPKCRECKQ
jgi:hypothetical protein